MTIDEAIQQSKLALSAVSDSAQIDALALVSHCTHLTQAQLFAYPELTLSAAQAEQLQHCIKRRCGGEPIAYILGEKEFWSLSLEVTPDVLIPRPETEDMVDWVLKNFPKEQACLVADLGVGSGAIAIALAYERPQWTIHATDKYPNALAVAKRNAERYGLNNIAFYLGDWCQALPKRHYDIMISNPPYIAKDDSHLAQLSFEPVSALASGDDGLSAIKTITETVPQYLVKNGTLVIEHGFDQQAMIQRHLRLLGYSDITPHSDLANIPRFVSAKHQLTGKQYPHDE